MGVFESLSVVTPPLGYVGEVMVSVCMSDQVANLCREVQGPLQVGVRVVNATHLCVGVGEVAVSASFCGRVGEPVRGGRSGVLNTLLELASHR